jgi:3-oxoacyl-[acyl-carrier-protein] synthase III
LTGSHGFKNVLVILSGRVKKHHRRLGPLDATVFSDGVASCTISSEHGEFEVLASYSRTNTYLASIGSSTFRSAGIAFENLRDVCGRIYAASGLRPEDIRAVIGSNLNLASLHLMAEAAQVDPDQVHADDVARLGHVHACDNLIGLHNYREGRTLRPGDNFILFGWSPHVASASLLRFLA